MYVCMGYLDSNSKMFKSENCAEDVKRMPFLDVKRAVRYYCSQLIACFREEVDFGSNESTARTSLHLVLGIIAAILRLLAVLVVLTLFLMLTHLGEADMCNFTPLFHQISS